MNMRVVLHGRHSNTSRVTLTELLSGFSVEITGKDVAALETAREILPPRTAVNITYLGAESHDLRVAAAQAVSKLGLLPVPHVAARRLRSHRELEDYLGAIANVGAADRVFLIGGDPDQPLGPFRDSLDVINSGQLGRHGVGEVGIAGYPEGHPDIDNYTLWQALTAKVVQLRDQGHRVVIVTQFGFDVAPVLRWLEELRARGIHAPLRIGVPGPVKIRRLLGHARRFGVQTSAGIVQKYGFSLTNLVGTTGPETFLNDLAAGLRPDTHGDVGVHFYTFGAIRESGLWVRNQLQAVESR